MTSKEKVKTLSESIESDLELNIWIHENVMKKCWHRFAPLPKSAPFWVCEKCEAKVYSSSRVDYCNDMSAARRVVEKMEDALLMKSFINHLLEHNTNFHWDWRCAIKQKDFYDVLTASPKAICLAALSAARASR